MFAGIMDRLVNVNQNLEGRLPSMRGEAVMMICQRPRPAVIHPDREEKGRNEGLLEGTYKLKKFGHQKMERKNLLLSQGTLD